MEREHITPQGVSVFHDKNESIHSFCLCLYVRAGSLFETKKENGISHFSEHIVFKNIHYDNEAKEIVKYYIDNNEYFPKLRKY